MPTTFSDEFLQKTRETWQPYYDEPLTDEDVFEIAFNWSRFIEFLADTVQRYEAEGRIEELDAVIRKGKEERELAQAEPTPEKQPPEVKPKRRKGKNLPSDG